MVLLSHHYLLRPDEAREIRLSDISIWNTSTQHRSAGYGMLSVRRPKTYPDALVGVKSSCILAPKTKPGSRIGWIMDRGHGSQKAWIAGSWIEIDVART